ncbi:ABC transporter ATP-binding protein/permease [Micromonospora sp. PLK6-60]|uniref:ATP-binding cassette domain-containing protein n=1 Tax=Micromonospora sp. PLK6-60 TaxID=2873383 RepID=UPI001CA763E0|nr:ABC transporter ATP-binding protein [Micromonospora sp. PLK6-60]MBY8871423.1 ABC transporter ATP-binding protein/permease [Micromonospora sp. PLK6-60]
MTTVGAVTRAALSARRGPLLRLAGWSLAEALPAALTGLLTARAVDEGFLAGRPGVGLLWLGLLALAVLVGALGTRQAYGLLGEVVEPFRDDLLRRVVAGTLAGASDGRGDDAAVTRLTHQVEMVRDTWAGLLMVVRGFVFAAGAAVVGLLSLAAPVALLVIAPVLVGLLLFAAALPAMVARQREYVRAGERLGRDAVVAVAGHRDVTVSGSGDRVVGWLGDDVDAQAGVERRLATMAAARSLSLAVGGWLPVPVLLLAAPWLLGQGLGPGALLGALVYVVHGIQPALHTLFQGVAAGGLRFVVTLDRLLRTCVPPAEPRVAAAGSPPDPAAPALSLRAVTFRYGPHAVPVLDGLDLAVPAGDHLAIVGASGIGKSTLAGLMAGVLRPQSGTVHLAGTPVDDLDAAERAARRVLIPQEAYVFTGTMRDNLRYLRPDLDDAAITRAADQLGLAGLVTRLGGLDATLRPAGLSAGERQQVALLRAWLSPAPLVILDEATCHLDPATEARLELAFAARPGTLVVIAHRISSAVRARRVLLLDGEHAHLDSHRGLLDSSAAYRELVGYWEGERVRSSTSPGRSAPLPSGSAPRSSP